MSHNERQIMALIKERLERSGSTQARAALASLAADIERGAHLERSGRQGRPTIVIPPFNLDGP